MIRRYIGNITILCGAVLSAAVPANASDQNFFDNGQVALRAADGGILEPAVPIFHNGVLIGGHNHKIVEAFDNVPGTGSFPLTFVDMPANTFLRATYQKANGFTGALGTSVVGSASFRTTAGLQFIPTVTRGDITTSPSVRYLSQITGNFGPQAALTTTRTYPDPVLGKTTVGLTVDFTAQQNINLATGGAFTGNDRMRMLTVSSMFSSSTSFDANMLRYEDSGGNIQTLGLSNLTPRNAHLLPAPDEIGGWFELIKNPGSAWFPDSPTVRIDLTDKGGLRLGVQGFLAGTTNPNDDSLSVWLEWLDAPNTIASGTTLSLGANIVATGDPDRPVIVGDLNSDGFVGVDDLNLVLGSWNQSVTHGQFTAGDPSGDGFVGVDDLNLILGNWNAGTPPDADVSQAIPEPASAVSIVIGCLILIRR
jgi:hypothetical protein